jgi:hypothetical protein
MAAKKITAKKKLKIKKVSKKKGTGWLSFT